MNSTGMGFNSKLDCFGRRQQRLSRQRAGNSLCRFGCGHEKSEWAVWKRHESKVAIEDCCLFIRRVDHNGKKRERTGGGPITLRNASASSNPPIPSLRTLPSRARRPMICSRQPADAHHLRFAQIRSLGRKVSDEYVVPLCRGHHREVHRHGDETAWWKKAGIDPIPQARALWLETHPIWAYSPRVCRISSPRPGLVLQASLNANKTASRVFLKTRPLHGGHHV
jgi:hypothetical protein